MKKLLSVIVLLSCFAAVNGQDEKAANLATRKYVIKFQPINYALQSYSFEVERMLNRKNALTIGVGIPNSGSLIGKYGIEASNDLKKLDLSSMHARLAYRHYGGNSGLPRGFYIEPYLKYQSLKGNFTKTFEENTIQGVTYEGNIDAKITTMNAGFQMGVQFMIAKRIAVDFYFLGLEGGIANVDLTGTPTPSDPQKIGDLKSEIQKGVNDLPSFLKDKITVTNTNESVIVKAKQLPYPWLRGGINVGIAF
jgi:hypothetical protein